MRRTSRVRPLVTSLAVGGDSTTSGEPRWRDLHGFRAEWDPSEPLIDVRGVSKTYIPSPRWMRLLLRSNTKQPIEALKGVTLRVLPGEICAIVGPNGAGKSTLFRVLTGLTTPTTGEAFVHGFDVTRQSFQVRQLIGFHAADERLLLLRHTCVENLMFHGRLQGIPERELKRRTREVLHLVGLERAAQRLALALSSGMKARLQLARALLHHPRVLILDEPTGSLDPVAAFEFLNLIKSVTTERGIATLLSSHRLEEIEALPEHVLLLDGGRVVYDGHLDSLRQLWEEPRRRLQFASPEAARKGRQFLESLPDVAVIATENAAIILQTDLTVGQLFVAADGHLDRVVSMEETRIPLRDVLAQVLRPPDGQT